MDIRIFAILMVFHFETVRADAGGVSAPDKAAVNFQPQPESQAKDKSAPKKSLAPQVAGAPAQAASPVQPQVMGPTLPWPHMAAQQPAQPVANVPMTPANPMGMPMAQPLPMVPPPNINSGQDDNQAQQIIQGLLSALAGQAGAPSPYLANGQPNPAYGEYIGGYTSYNGQYGVPVHNGNYEGLQNLHITNPADAARFLKGHRCNPNDRDRLVCMVCNLYFEAANEPREGQMALAQSVMTRVFSGAYEDTVCKNVYKSNGRVAQYSWTLENKDHTLPNSSKVDELIQVASAALRKGPNGVTNYFNYRIANPAWGYAGNCARTSTRIGNHQFCSINGVATRTVEQVARAEGLSVSEVRTQTPTSK